MEQLTVTAKWQQPVAILAQIPWGHNLAIISKCASVKQAFFYVRKTIENNWEGPSAFKEKREPEFKNK